VNIKEYISSGILEAYVLGELSAVERAEVERNLEQYPALQEELRIIEETQEQLLMKLAVSPSQKVKENLFKNLDKSDNVRQLNTDTSRVWKYAAAASIAVALVAGIMAYNYWSKWQKAETDYNNLIAQNQRIAEDYNQVNKRLDKIESDLKVIENPDFVKVTMKGTPNAPQSLATVYWNDKTSEVFLSAQNMKQLAAENQYQLWAIIDGKPVDAGVFDMDAGGLLKMKDIQKGAAMFAVTVEPRGGKSSPTLETMQVAGEVKKG
jgi:anti-sigma-K factor RskA